MKKILVGPNGVRAGWRFISFVAIWLFLDHQKNRLIWDVIKYKNHPLWHPIDFFVWDGPEFAVTLLSAYLMMKLVERGRWSFGNYGLGFAPNSFALFLEGLLSGLLASTIVMLLLYVAGAASFEGVALSGTLFVHFAVFWLFAWVVSGLHDELLFHGYPLFTLATGIGFWSASILLSLAFGGLLQYLFSPMKSFAHLLNVSLIAFFCCLTFRRTGSLWFAIGFQAMFAYATLVLYAAPTIGNKGKSVEGFLLNIKFHGSPWLTGGAYGIEASILIFPVIAALFLVFDRLHRKTVFMPEHSWWTQTSTYKPVPTNESDRK